MVGISNKKGAKAPPQALSCKALNGVKTFEHKKCLFCGSKQVKKDGKQNGKQRYKCHHCGKRFSSGKHIHPQALWQAYTVGKQTAAQLAEQYKCSRQTILRHLKAAIPKAGISNKNQYSVGSSCCNVCTVCGSPPCPDLNLIHYTLQQASIAIKPGCELLPAKPRLHLEKIEAT